MASLVELAHVRKGKGRTHLTVSVRRAGPVLTLCNQRLPAGEFQVVEDEADCSLCLRRQANPALISGQLFEQDEGARLLELSLAQARKQRAEQPARKAAPPAPPKLHVARQPEPEPERIGELELAGLKKVSERLYRSPGGVLVRLGRDGRLQEVVHDGPSQLERSGDAGLRLKVGDVQIEVSHRGDLRARLSRPPR